MKYAHTMIRVTNIEKSLAFYQDLIGLQLTRTMELEDATLYFLTDEFKCCSIELTYNHKLPESGYSHGTHFGHLAFETPEMGKFSEKMKSFGSEYTIEPFDIKEGGPKIAFLDDPDGLHIEIIERPVSP